MNANLASFRFFTEKILRGKIPSSSSHTEYIILLLLKFSPIYNHNDNGILWDCSRLCLVCFCSKGQPWSPLGVSSETGLAKTASDQTWSTTEAKIVTVLFKYNFLVLLLSCITKFISFFAVLFLSCLLEQRRDHLCFLFTDSRRTPTLRKEMSLSRCFQSAQKWV